VAEAKYVLNISNAAGTRQFIVTDFTSLQYQRVVNDSGLLSFSVPDTHPMALTTVERDWQIEVIRSRASDPNISNAITAYTDFGGFLRDEERVNRMEIEIDRDLSGIIARRQPTARDLRLLIAISKIIANLERVGDEAARIARVVQRLAAVGMPGRRLPVGDLQFEADLAVAQLRKALDAELRLREDENVLARVRESNEPAELRAALQELSVLADSPAAQVLRSRLAALCPPPAPPALPTPRGPRVSPTTASTSSPVAHGAAALPTTTHSAEASPVKRERRRSSDAAMTGCGTGSCAQTTPSVL
jgi:hypothetical protein